MARRTTTLDEVLVQLTNKLVSDNIAGQFTIATTPDPQELPPLTAGEFTTVAPGNAVVVQETITVVEAATDPLVLDWTVYVTLWVRLDVDYKSRTDPQWTDATLGVVTRLTKLLSHNGLHDLDLLGSDSAQILMEPMQFVRLTAPDHSPLPWKPFVTEWALRVSIST